MINGPLTVNYMISAVTCNIQRVVVLSAVAHVFNTDVLRTVVQLNISDGQVVESRYRSVDDESISEILVHDAI